MRIIESIKARSTNFKANHFDMFEAGKKIAKLKGVHCGKRCVIVGNGPSLQAKDLEFLKQNSEITFAFNRIYHIFSETSWRPTYYISQDEKMLAGCVKEVEALEAEIKFIPAEMGWYHGVNVDSVHTFHIMNQHEDELPGFSENVAQYVVNSNTVVYTAIQFAVYMGIKEIYLIGVDHHFRTSMNDKGEIVVDSSAKDYFCDNYNQDKENLYVPNIDKSTLAYIAAKKYADAHEIQIFNATRGGKLEVFPRVDFDIMFNSEK